MSNIFLPLLPAFPDICIQMGRVTKVNSAVQLMLKCLNLKIFEPLSCELKAIQKGISVGYYT